MKGKLGRLAVVIAAMCLAGCGAAQETLVAGKCWHIKVYDCGGDYISELSGTWRFYEDGALKIDSAMKGTSEINDGNIDFQAGYEDTDSVLADDEERTRTEEYSYCC